MSNCQCTATAVCDACDSGLTITAGLDSLPRQIADFAEFRSRMLKDVLEHDALADWRPCTEQDFGLMLLEMWAYVADVQSFYDQVIANESYLRTAQRKPSLRKLVDLLGYVPRPAVAASACVAVLAEGRQPITLPKGLAFRSSAFDDEAPQVFELDADSTIHPLHNRWQLEPAAATTLTSSGTATSVSFSTILVKSDTSLKHDDVVLVYVSGGPDSYTQVRTVSSIDDYEDELGNHYKELSFNQALNLRGDFAPSAVTLCRATQTGGLWTHGHISGDAKAIDDDKVVLDGLYRNIKTGQYLVIESDGVYQWFKVTSISDVSMTLSAATTDTVKDADGNDIAIAIPAVTAPASRLQLNKTVEEGDWTYQHTDKMTLHYALDKAGEMVLAPDTTLQVSAGSSTDLALEQPVETPLDPPVVSQVQLKDKNDQGAEVGASIDYTNAQLQLDQNTELSAMSAPVAAYGNIVTLSRGESVVGEVLGSGDATLANQFFTLKKAPLTYVNAATSDNEQGVLSTLTVYVDGVAWQEVSHLYGVDENQQVYYLRTDDDGNTRVHFGDGRNGARLPTGSNNIIADYRFGAGKAAPPAGALNQLAKPFKGVTGVVNAVDASIGDDAEPATEIRELAPRSALLLGRAISIEDMQVAAANVSGVEAADAQWRWQQNRQRAGVQVWYLGDESIKTTVHEKLRLLSDENTPITVDVVTPLPLGLSVDIDIDERYQESDVLSQVRDVLLDADDGFLQAANRGFTEPLFRSAVFEKVLSVPGTIAVRGLLIRYLFWEFPWNFTAITAVPGYVWDFSAGGLTLNGQDF